MRIVRNAVDSTGSQAHRVVRGTLVPAVLALLCGAASASTETPRPAEMMPNAATSILLDVASVGGRFVAVGEHGDIVISTNAHDWQQVAAPVRAMLTRVRFLNDKLGWAVGHDGTILKTADGGMTWVLQFRDAAKGLPFYDVLFLDPQNGFAVGANGMFKVTTDGGASWNDSSGPVINLGLNFNAICRLRDGSLLTAGEKGLVARSTDNGKTWTMLKSPYPGSYFGALPLGDKGVLLYGLRGHVYAIDDPKKAPSVDPAKFDEFNLPSITDAAEVEKMGWRTYDSPQTHSLFGGTLLADNRFLLVGVDGTILKGSAAQTTLTPVAASSSMTLAGVVADAGRVVAVGHDGFEVIEGAVTP